jgi:hypothetical protein
MLCCQCARNSGPYPPVQLSFEVLVLMGAADITICTSQAFDGRMRLPEEVRPDDTDGLEREHTPERHLAVAINHCWANCCCVSPSVAFIAKSGTKTWSPSGGWSPAKKSRMIFSEGSVRSAQ